MAVISIEICRARDTIADTMSSRLEELLSRTLLELERRNKPLPPLPRPRRPPQLTDYFLPSPPHQSEVPSLATESPSQDSLSGFPVFQVPPAPLAERPCLQQKFTASSAILEERITLLEQENRQLRHEHKVLYKQISDHRRLIREYEGCLDKVDDHTEHSKAVVDAIERIAVDINSNIESYETARGDVQRVERAVARDWRRFAIENASIGIDVDKVAKDTDSMEITIYPYKSDPTMI